MKKSLEVEKKGELIIKGLKIIVRHKYRVLYMCESPGVVVDGECIWRCEDLFIIKDEFGEEFTFKSRYVQMICISEDD